MVFANLSPSEKDAFFGLLDEYFASRPDVFGSIASDSGSIGNHPAATKAAASAIHNAFTNHVNAPGNEESSVPAWRRQLNSSSSSLASPNPNADISSSVGRVAAAAAAFRSTPVAGGPQPPRPPARKLSTYGSPEPDREPPPSTSPPLPPARTPSTTNRLVQAKRFGDVDVTSAKGMYSSIRHGTANKTAVAPSVAPPVPPAFAAKKNTFAPPPLRHAPSSASSEVRATPPPPPARPRQPEPEPEPEPEEPGEWAEALYPYNGTDADDLDLQAGQQVWVVERTSDDWWTAIYEGKRGLIPAGYVKML